MGPDEIQKSDGSKKVGKDPDLPPIQYRQSDGSLSDHAHDKHYMEMTLNSGDHSDLVKKILRQRIESRAREFPRWPGSDETGVRALWIESRFWYDRERYLPDFDDDWRKYRSKYIHSLELDPREPVHVPEFERTMLNPIRRFYMIPGNWIESGLVKVFKLDKFKSAVYRTNISRFVMVYLAAIGIYTNYRWYHSSWTHSQGWTVLIPAPLMLADHPKFPFKDYRTEPHHHYDQDFARRKIYEDLRDWEDTTHPL